MEFNKVFAAFLVAALTLMSAIFTAEFLYPVTETPVHDAAADDSAHTATPMATIVPKSLNPITPLLAMADLEAGKKRFRLCATCHTVTKDGPRRTGPNLWNIVGAKKAGKSGFSYSKALTEKGGTWTYEDLNKFLNKPKKYIPGTKMTFIGLKKDKDRANVIAWLRSLSDNPAPIE